MKLKTFLISYVLILAYFRSIWILFYFFYFSRRQLQFISYEYEDDYESMYRVSQKLSLILEPSCRPMLFPDRTDLIKLDGTNMMRRDEGERSEISIQSIPVLKVSSGIKCMPFSLFMSRSQYPCNVTNTRGAQHANADTPASKRHYIVSGWALNSTHSLTKYRHLINYGL